ncbi:SET and MYND domain-containing protein 4-like isoform X2 [Homarus americanus]|uniref:SET and MYND domain-containing protein 4-like isoform X2 n=1 Tax=Homarus americanus TaxID=6706 RepID=UPI001C4838ED|nr:SET and MYND domain-containing protein 4-like isoform X2 [Homarus americanus]
MAQVNDMEYLVRCFTFAMLKRNKMQEMEKKIVPQNTTEEMFAYIWGLDEAHSYLAPKLCFPSKSKGNATQYCRQGDMAFRKHKLCEALKYYNLAILSAPHPDSESSPRKGATSLNQVESILAQAFKSRSVVLFEIKRYEKCSDDIDLALKFGYPQTSCKKLLDMKIKCQKLISADKERVNPSAKALGPDDLYFAFEIPNPPPLAESNPTIPSLSSAVKMTFSQTMGRHVIAAKDINPGEILGVDEGYCSAVFFEDMKTYCTVCLTRCLTPLPCPCCSMVIFCSEECQKQGLSGCHWQECPILPTFSALDMGKNPYLAYRILMKISHVRLKEIMPLLQCEAKTQAPETLGFNKEGIYDATDYRSVYHLVTNKDKRSKSDLIRRCMQAFIVTKLLQQSGRYFLDSDGKPLAPSHEDIILTGSTLIHHMMNLICNAEADGIMEIDLTDPMMGSINESFGFGIYPGVCLLNHSCNPTCARITYGLVPMTHGS